MRSKARGIAGFALALALLGGAAATLVVRWDGSQIARLDSGYFAQVRAA
jgi:hypothetical protein